MDQNDTSNPRDSMRAWETVPESVPPHGRVRVNGELVDGIGFKSALEGKRAGVLDLTFVRNGIEIERATLGPDEALQVLGAHHLDAIRAQLLQAKPGEHTHAGWLTGRDLSFRAIEVPASASVEHANSIETATSEISSKASTMANRERVSDAATGHSTSASRDGAAPHDARAIPEAVLRRFRHDGNRFYFEDHTLAFVDGGGALRAHTENRAVIRDLVSIAHARGWTVLAVRGTELFRQEVWLNANRLGLAVEGFAPAASPAADLRTRTPTRPPHQGEHPSAPDDPARSPRPRVDPRVATVFGTLIDHGEAAYKFDARNAMSYFVRIEHGHGQVRTYWGTGLRQALGDVQPPLVTGDAIGLRQQGATPVSVTTRERDADGVLSDRTIQARRNTWVIVRAEHVQAEAGAQTPADALTATPNAPTHTEQPEKRRNAQQSPVSPDADATRDTQNHADAQLHDAVIAHHAAHEQFADAFVAAGLIPLSQRAQVIATLTARLATEVRRLHVIAKPERARVAQLIEHALRHAAAARERTAAAEPSTSHQVSQRTPASKERESMPPRA
jgi:hypothetical protein